MPLGGDRAFVGHALRGTQLFCDGAAGRLLQALDEPRTLLELEAALEGHDYPADSARVAVIVDELRGRGLLTEQTPEQEIAEARRWALETQARSVEQGMRQRMRAELAPVERWSGAAAAESRRAVVLGWCTAEALAPALREEARARGVELGVVTGFESDFQLVRDHDPDFTLLLLGSFRLLAPLFASDSALEPAVAECRRLIQGVAEHCRGPLLVAGAVAPQREPLGLAAALGGDSAGDRVFELNRGIRRAVREVPSALYLDLDRAFACQGKAELLDDLVAPWAHAGALGGADNRRFHAIVVQSCLDAFDALGARGHIRCVAVDLDGVLWPGELADPDFSFEDPARVQSLVYGVHAGLHEALRALRSRGILLAVISKNVRERVLEAWTAALGGSAGSGMLAPDDFALLKIGWGDKSRAAEELCRELGIEPSALAFIDDSPLERAEVRHALPEVWVLDEPLPRLRETLLSSPRFEVLGLSDEARARAQTTAARLERDRAGDRAADRAAFLASLDVRCLLKHEHDAKELDRIAELVARTNQFRTTAERPSRRELERLARDPRSTLTSLSVCDRFGNYGLTGVALTSGSEVRLVTLSCRVIGAEVHPVLFRAALQRCRARAPGADVVVRFADTPHNAPARRLFDGVKLDEHPDGRVLRAGSDLPALPSHCAITQA